MSEHPARGPRGMTNDPEWGDTTLPPTRKGPPKWMIACGCGCLIPGFFMVALVAWGMQYFSSATNPRVAYEVLAAVFPYDDELLGRPTGLVDDPSTRSFESHEDPEFDVLFGAEIPFSGGLAMFYFGRGVRTEGSDLTFEEDALIALVTRIDSEHSDSVLTGDPTAEGRWADVEVQGRTLSVHHVSRMTSDVLLPFPHGTTEVTGEGAIMKVLSDVPESPGERDGKLFDVLLTLQRPGDEGGPIRDEEIRAFLAPFHVGPER